MFCALLHHSFSATCQLKALHPCACTHFCKTREELRDSEMFSLCSCGFSAAPSLAESKPAEVELIESELAESELAESERGACSGDCPLRVSEEPWLELAPS